MAGAVRRALCGAIAPACQSECARLARKLTNFVSPQAAAASRQRLGKCGLIINSDLSVFLSHCFLSTSEKFPIGYMKLGTVFALVLLLATCVGGAVTNTGTC